MGLYCKINIVLFYLSFYLIYLITKKEEKKEEFKLISIKRYKRYFKIILTKKVMITIMLFSIISNFIFLFQNNKYEKIYKDLDNKEISLQGIISRLDKDKYNFKVTKGKYKNLSFYLKVSNNNVVKKIKYGDEIVIKGTYEAPAKQSNYKGFNYQNYLKTLKIYGTIKANKVSRLNINKKNVIFKLIYKLYLIINNKIESLNLNTSEKEIIKGILIGDKQNISKEIKDDFAKSNISYILAISGMHIWYLSFFVSFVLNKLIGKHYAKPITSIFILVYIVIVNYIPSVVRAGVTAIITIMSNFFYRKNDVFEAISLSFFILLIYNPYLLFNVGLQLSFAGTIGIIAVSPILNHGVSEYLEKINNKAIRKNNKRIKVLIKILKNIFFVGLQKAFIATISANFLVMPIILLNYNVISITSLFISSIASFLVGPIIIFGFLAIIFKFKLFEIILELLIKILVKISSWGSKIFLNQIYFITPSLVSIIMYYVLFFCLIFIFKIYLEKDPNAFYKRIKDLISLIKYKIKLNRKKNISLILIIIMFISLCKCIPKNLKIYFIDVGQGDSCLIVTPKNKTILIDGGGSELKDFNIGEKTLLPYLLNRKISKIDYAIISHFDTDHCVRYFVLNGKYKS